MFFDYRYWEIIVIVLYSGEFGDVYKGTIKTGGHKDIVAVKVLRVN